MAHCARFGRIQLVLLIGVALAYSQTEDPCSTEICKPGRICKTISSGSSGGSGIVASCVCAPPVACRSRRRPKPVCGSDGRVYPSHCEMHRVACLTNRKLRPLPTESCVARTDASKVHLPSTTSSESSTAAAVSKTLMNKLKINCDISETSAVVTSLRSGLMTLQCQKSGLKKGCSDYKTSGKDAPQIMDRIFAYLDFNSNGRVSELELVQKLTKLDCSKEVANRLLGKNRGDGADRIRLAEALTLPKETLAGSQRSHLIPSESGQSVDLTCPLGSPLGPAESIRWTRRDFIEIINANSSTLPIENPNQFDSGVYKCCSSLWPRLCSRVALSVVAPPFVQVKPSILVRRLGESARLDCDVTGGGPGLQGGLSWLFNGAPVSDVQGAGADVIVQKTDIGSSLYIAKIDRSHTGMYTCRTSNVAGVAEFAATIYVRLPTETDYNSYPLSPTSTVIAAFHAGGCSVVDPTDCSVGSAASADFDDVTLCENLVSCAWGPVASAGRHIVYAAQPSLGRLLAMQPQRWLAFEPVQLNCPPVMLAYRQPTDQLWIACGLREDEFEIFVVDSAASATTTSGHRRLARRWTVKKAVNDGNVNEAKMKLRRVLRLPDSRSGLLVAMVDSDSTTAASAATPSLDVLVVDVTDGREDAKTLVRFGLASTETNLDRADLLVQGGTLILHSSMANGSEPTILALDLRTGVAITRRHLFPAIDRNLGQEPNGETNPAGRVFASEDGRHVLHLSGSNVYVYEVLSTGELSLLLHDVAGIGIRSAQFQASPDGGLRILARTQRDGAILVIDLRARVFQLVFDDKLDKKPSLSAPSFGDLALVHSGDAAVFFNTTSLSVTNCKDRLFVDLQALHWIGT